MLGFVCDGAVVNDRRWGGFVPTTSNLPAARLTPAVAIPGVTLATAASFLHSTLSRPNRWRTGLVVLGPIAKEAAASRQLPELRRRLLPTGHIELERRGAPRTAPATTWNATTDTSSSSHPRLRSACRTTMKSNGLSW
ncbi:hypothetical protein C2845_PM02G09600 [Panicum miliaceum]|uniref:Uncharacterized protein n=1 Tax=Panicum miliaceum TaxID=4540 RepID=A0A3L6S985_PANMI|nr:hypothetical protein C2845_PM02G09600 [Panicum miliaceum]